jgi:hypothetical protein
MIKASAQVRSLSLLDSLFHIVSRFYYESTRVPLSNDGRQDDRATRWEGT